MIFWNEKSTKSKCECIPPENGSADSPPHFGRCIAVSQVVIDNDFVSIKSVNDTGVMADKQTSHHEQGNQ